MSWVLTGVPTSTLIALLGALGAAVLALYVLKLRRRPVEVPFAALWRQVVEQRRGRTLWERLKWLLSLLVHLLLLGLLLLALGDPRTEQQLRDGRTVVLLVDTSASMATLDEIGQRTRMERARDHARDVLRSLGPRDAVMLARMDGRVEALAPFGPPDDSTDALLATLEPTASAADLETAVRFAVDSLEGAPRPELVIVSDGATPSLQERAEPIEVPPRVDVTYVPVGSSADNVGFTAFNVRRYPADRTSYEVFLQVQNFSEAAATVEIGIYGEGELADLREVSLGPGEEAVRIYEEVPSAGRRLEARLRVVSGDVVDRFAMDDVAYALLPDRGVPRVLLVTEGNLYLEGPLLLNESIDLEVVHPDELSSRPTEETTDITIHDGGPVVPIHEGNHLVFEPTPPHSPWELDEERVLADPIIHSLARGHTLTRWIRSLRDVHILRARRLELESDDRVIASAVSGAPLIVAREDPSLRAVGVAFDVRASDLPLRVAFPVFLLNAIDWLTNETARLADSYRAGESWEVPLRDRSASTVAVGAPSGRTLDVPVHDGRAVFFGDEVGFWRIGGPDGSELIAANLASPAESTIAPSDTIPVRGAQAVEEIEARETELRGQPWMWILAVVLALLLLEWWTWNRRWTV